MNRRFLVVVRAGDRSLHPSWLASGERRWDLAVSYFGRDPALFRGGEAPRFDDPGTKYPGLHALFGREAFWRGYDYIWLPDDDLAIRPADVDAFFATVAEHELDLAQPSVAWRSFWSHRLTLHRPSLAVRFTRFVEIMAPCFSRAFLEVALPTFSDTVTGWGLDLVWPQLRPERPPRCGIVDRAQVDHTRPIGGPVYAVAEARGVTAQGELEQLRARYGLRRGATRQAIGAVDHDGRRYDLGRLSERWRFAASEARDRLAFERWRWLQHALPRGPEPLR